MKCIDVTAVNNPAASNQVAGCDGERPASDASQKGPLQATEKNTLAIRARVSTRRLGLHWRHRAKAAASIVIRRTKPRVNYLKKGESITSLSSVSLMRLFRIGAVQERLLHPESD